jgi:hypothetical protein
VLLAIATAAANVEHASREILGSPISVYTRISARYNEFSLSDFSPCCCIAQSRLLLPETRTKVRQIFVSCDLRLKQAAIKTDTYLADAHGSSHDQENRLHPHNCDEPFESDERRNKTKIIFNLY